MAPATPHITAELWQRRALAAAGGADVEAHIHRQAWPVADPAMLVAESVTMVVQVGGKVRDRIEVSPEISEDDAIAAALALPKIAELVGDTEPRKVIARPPKLVNIVL
jgi:leucyl-tRNA synthetase